MYVKVMENEASNIDRYFGISVDEKREYLMGDKVIEIPGDDIVVDDVTYKGTPGLWSLILLNKPKKYTTKDMEEYKNLVKQTNAMTNPHNQVKGKTNPQNTWKWKHILKKMEKKKVVSKVVKKKKDREIEFIR